MKILFVGKNENGSIGVEKKLDAQIAALRRLGHTVHYTVETKEGVHLHTGESAVPLAIYAPAKSRFSTVNDLHRMAEFENALPKAFAVTEQPYDLLYIRKRIFNPWQRRALKFIRRRHSARVVIELPTYPYDREWKTYPGYMWTIWPHMDRLFRHTMRTSVDSYAVVFGTAEPPRALYGVPAISIGNGVEVAALPVHQTQPPADGSLNLVCVSTMSHWHGYDRLIQGLINYKKTSGMRLIKLHIVGDGPCITPWRELSEREGVANMVTFYGRTDGHALDEIFDCCQVAVCSLAAHRKGIYQDSALKTREYVARGLPLICSSRDELLSLISDTGPYVLVCPLDESPIDMNAVLAFWGALGEPAEAARRLRTIAEKHCTWETQLAKVLAHVCNPTTLKK